MKRILSSFTIAIIVSLFLLATPAVGQGSATIEQLEIAFWPEFDRSEVLVIYRILLAEGTTLPAQVSLPIPTEVGEPSAIAWQNAEGVLIIAEYQREVTGNWATITLETESRLAQVEFYLDLNIVGTQRNFTFTWPGGYSAGLLTYEIQEPVDASEFVIDPPAESSATGDFGLNYHRANLGSLFPTSEFSIDFSYSKVSDTLSVDAIPTQPVVPTSEPVMPTGGTPDVAELLPWIVGGAGGVLLLVAIVLFIRYRSDQTRTKPTHRPRRRRPSSEGQSREMEASPVFCHNCGTKASASDFYCRRCGTQLRR